MSKVTYANEEISKTLPYKKLKDSNVNFSPMDVYTP